MCHDSGMSLSESGYARRPDGMNSFLGSFFLQMAGSTAGLGAVTRGPDLLNLLLPLQRFTGRRP